MIAVREFTSAAECIAHAQAVRRKFFAPIKVMAAPIVELAEVIQPPKSRYVKKERPVKRGYLNAWEVHPTSFNHHVIAWRRYLLMVAMQVDGQMLDIAEFEERKSILEIVWEVLAEHPGVTVADLKGHRRNRRITLPRQVAMYEVYTQRKDMTLPAIGRWFGGKDHTTVLHAVRKMRKMMEAA
jgi:hypothetical protein